jgi:hypothetical protein
MLLNPQGLVKSKFNMIKRDDGVLLYAISSELESIGLKKLIYKALTYFDFNRGKTAAQIEALVRAHENGKKGPLSFTGGIKIYIEPNLIFITKSTIKHDCNLKLQKTLSLEEFNRYLPTLFTSSTVSYPFYVRVEKRVFSYQNSARINGQSVISPCKLLRYWKKPENKSVKLSLSLPKS